VCEIHAGQPEECKYFEPVAVVVGDAGELGVGIKRDHDVFLSLGRAAPFDLLGALLDNFA
jgi:hypothetical protein